LDHDRLHNPSAAIRPIVVSPILDVETAVEIIAGADYETQAAAVAMVAVPPVAVGSVGIVIVVVAMVPLVAAGTKLNAELCRCVRAAQPQQQSSADYQT
jgi:hypothetical protein